MIEFSIGEERQDDPSPDMTPMIDIIFQLLIFFTLTSFALKPAIELALPKSDHADTRPLAAIEVTVPPNGPFVVDGVAADSDELRPALKEARRRTGSKSEPAVSVMADREAAFKRIVEVMDAAQAEGLGSLRFIVESEAPPAGGERK
jgi:biopolymer transport protein ExbD